MNEGNLDRDFPNPNKYTFQIVAREKDSLGVSAPISVTVHLNDINDNVPVLPLYLPINVPADDENKKIFTVKASDRDENDNITYSIYHVSNNGNKKFKIDPSTGVIESISKLNAGEQYSLTIQATDLARTSSQAILEVNVIPGPNKQPPIFDETNYNVEVSEGVVLNSSIITIKVRFKEKLSYSVL